ncbi:site-specific integrase [Phytomonospora sp. NPDC050363]|uniref:tyrosine-type recombinase/integrase n=1 Tax=Phytomonospora sp. NPDC050363 TaxID=3155642 RepID=UPI0033DC2B7B
MGWLLEALEVHPGATWQERWEAAGCNRDGNGFSVLVDSADGGRHQLRTAAGHAFAMRLIQPSLDAMSAVSPPRYAPMFLQVTEDRLLRDFRERLELHPASDESKSKALASVCRALTVFGIDLPGLTPEAVLFYADRKRGSTLATAWPVLHDMGRFPAWVPRTLQDARVRGQRSVEELVERHQLRDQEIKNLLIDYIRRRSVEVDYATMENIVRNLVYHFWRVVEDINPEQSDLRLGTEIVTEWKQRLLVRDDGKARQHIEGPFLTVRAFYIDLQTWAAAEPERWARWVAPCPIRDADLRWFNQRRRRLSERMADRTRERQPLLPILSEYVTTKWLRLRDLLDDAGRATPGEYFVSDGVTWQRVSGGHRRNDPSVGPVRAVNGATGELTNLTVAEDQAFWQWAMVETLRHAGLRREELVELTHLSVRLYRRPNGEVVALLVVSPSKSDRERVIPMSAELFHVIAQVIRRHTRVHGTVPVCPRYDTHERSWAEPLPYLFQRLQSGVPRAMSVYMVRDMLKSAATELIPTHPQFAKIRFAPHDFRRLFATDLVNNGLPIHIGAALLGHLDIQTTRGYVAVFDEDVITHYQQFLDHRRTKRPTTEYRSPSSQEWNDFEEHFDKRKVELGSCGRPYGTPCAHEHACIRCPMLSINPRMLPRLDEIEEDLLARRERAEEEGWRGEIEGIDQTLVFLRAKKTQSRRALAPAMGAQVELGMPQRRT